jgi:tetratricopeptide (TPR) repeat protein
MFTSFINARSEISLKNPKLNWHSFFNYLKDVCSIDTFIESGTYLAETTKEAAECFECVYTVEVNREYYEQSMKSLEGLHHVALYHGDSSNVLPEILPQLKAAEKKIIFWLDGHFMSSMIGEHDSVLVEYGYTPIRQELKAIAESGIRNAIVLIDDIRLFGTELNGSRLEKVGNADYPMIHDVIKCLDAIDYTTVIYGDILFAYDKALHLSFSPLINACTVSRNFNGTNYTVHQLLDAERVIAQATEEEKASLHQLFLDFSQQWKGWRNRSPHYNLWEGLMLLENKKFNEALEQFMEVAALGYNHWRIYWYLAQSYFGLGEFAEAKKALEIVLSQKPDFSSAYELAQELN